jgi:UDP-glucose 4-epimerase
MSRGRALVTGAGGFIGSHLVERLVHDGWEVRALVRYTSRGTAGWLDAAPPEIRSAVEIVHGNVEDPGGMLAAVHGAAVVFHLAALIGIPYSYVAPEQYVATNVTGTLNVLEAARAHRTDRVVCVSTSEVYGTARYTPIDEDHPLQAQSPYSATKIGAEKLAQSYALSFGMPVCVVRPFNAFGPRQSMRAVIPTVVVQSLTQHEIRLGALDPIRDFTFVTDTVAGMVAAATARVDAGSVFNVGGGEAVTIGRLVELVQEICGTSLPLVTDAARIRPKDSEVRELRCDAARARRLLGWEPGQSLEQGLRETVEWIRANLERFRPTVYAV